MNKERIREISMYGLIIIAIILQSQTSSSFFRLAIWIGLFSISFFLQTNNSFYRANEEKAKLIIISIIVYYIAYIFLGLLTGYRNSPYSLKITEIIKNIIFIVGIQVLQEGIRTKLLHRSKNMWMYITITIIFILLRMDYTILIQSFGNLEGILQYTLVEFLPIVVESTLLSYLSITGGYLLNYSYTISNGIALILIPIFPDVDWFITTTSRYVLYLIIFLFVSYEHFVKVKRGSKKQIRKENPIKTIPLIVMVIITVSFIAGLFPYKPVAIMSNSMVPTFSKGDACIVKQIKTKEEIQQLRTDDIIEYELNNTFVIHRIIGIEKQGAEIKFITKGDNNDTRDLLSVSQEQIVGVVKYTIPYLGYPSVWFTEILLTNRNI